MLKVTIEGVLENGETVHKVLEGSFVSVMAINHSEERSEMRGTTAGGGIAREEYVEHAVCSLMNNTKQIARDTEEEGMLLRQATEQLKKRLDELAKDSGQKQESRSGLKMAVLAGDDVKEFLKGLLE